jgi:hypothetical protein
LIYYAQVSGDMFETNFLPIFIDLSPFLGKDCCCRPGCQDESEVVAEAFRSGGRPLAVYAAEFHELRLNTSNPNVQNVKK